MDYLLAGKPPYSGTNMVEKVSGRLLGDAERARGPRGGQPALDVVLRRMMAKEPQDRFQTADELASALLPFCVPAPPVLPVARVGTAEPAEPQPQPQQQPTAVPNSAPEAIPASSISKSTLLFIVPAFSVCCC